MMNNTEVKNMLELVKNRTTADIDAIVKLHETQRENERALSDLHMREQWAKYLVWYLLFWSTILFTIIILHGFGNAFGYFKISENLLSWILLYGVANFFIFPFLVSQYLFSQKKEEGFWSRLLKKFF